MERFPLGRLTSGNPTNQMMARVLYSDSESSRKRADVKDAINGLHRLAGAEGRLSVGFELWVG